MAFWNGETLRRKLPDIVTPFRGEAIDCAACTLTIGREIYVSPAAATEDAATQTVRRLSDGEGFTIPPGQVAFLLTEEAIELPNNVLALISMKARIKFRGLINVSGFHVDPGFRGKLIFSVFNAGPVTIHLKQGDDCFLIWFADLDQPSEEIRKKPVQTSIPSELLTQISGELHSFGSLASRIKDLQADLIERIQTAETSIHQTETTLRDRVNDIAQKQTYYQVAIVVLTLFLGVLLRDFAAKVTSTTPPSPAPAPATALAPPTVLLVTPTAVQQIAPPAAPAVPSAQPLIAPSSRATAAPHAPRTSAPSP